MGIEKKKLRILNRLAESGFDKYTPSLQEEKILRRKKTMEDMKNTEKVTLKIETFEELKDFIETMTDSTLVRIDLTMVLENEQNEQ